MKTNCQSILRDNKIIARALEASFAKLSPKTQVKNPIIFFVYISALLISWIYVLSLFGSDRLESAFTLATAAALWLTVLLANFAEAIGEGHDNACADVLCASKLEIEAHRLPPTVQRDYVTFSMAHIATHGLF